MTPTAIDIFEIVLVLVGCGLWLWTIFDGHARRWFQKPELLPRWEVAPLDFVGFAAVAFLTYYLAPVAAVILTGVDLKAPGARTALLIPTFAAHLALITTCLLFRAMPAGKHSESTMSFSRTAITGICAIVFVFPLVAGLVQGWDLILKQGGIDAPRQPMIDYLRNAGRPGELSLWVILAAVTAPMSEELFFRGGLFRFLGTLMPTWWAALASSVFWALLHENLLSSLPLIAFGMMLCVLYQKTGRILAPMVVHGLFNLNTVLVALYGTPG